MSRWIEQHQTLLLLTALIATALVYLPGLRGGFIYDDWIFLVDNPAVKVATLELGDWIAALNSFPAAHQGRWLGMFSFAANHFANGLDPYAYKLTNLIIHLGNGCLLWLVLRALADLATATGASAGVSRSGLATVALLTTAIWLILPINLTAVLYVAQRLESLSNTFVLLGLWGFLRIRLRDWHGEATGMRITAIIAGCTGVGVLVKESAILLPLYVACIEFALTRMRRADGRRSDALLPAAIVCLAVPLLIGGWWLSTWIGGERSYARDFDLGQRLLTQGRVLLLYVQWTLLPNLSDLTLYHDDIRASRSLWDPASTLPALLAVLAMLGVAVRLRRSAPLAALGLLWFLAGHALTSTVIPLTLAFEHRNYFPSTGLSLALVALVAARARSLSPRLLGVIAGIACIYYGGTTCLRALEWSQPLRLAASEAAKRPQSANAQYEYARALIEAAGYDPSHPLSARALEVLSAHRDLPDAGLLFDNAIVRLKAGRNEAVAPEEWEATVARVSGRAPRSSDVGALGALYACMRSGECPRRMDIVERLFQAVLSHRNADPGFHSAYAIFVFQERGDIDAALEAFAAALQRKPGNPEILANRAAVLIAARQFDAARAAIDELAGVGILGSVDRLVAPLRQQLRQAELEPRPEAPDIPSLEQRP